MKLKLFTLFLLFTIILNSCAQANNNYEFILDYDFSSIIKGEDHPSYDGYADTSYQKMCFVFDSVVKESNRVYLVSGRTKIKENEYSFNGKLKIDEIVYSLELNTGVDDEMLGKVLHEGMIKGSFALEEDKSKEGSGIFNGQFTSNWYIDTDNKIHYDDIEGHSDGYSNNQFIGTLNRYNKSRNKIINRIPVAWGQYRIPNSGDLDIGAGEFSVNPKYLSNGWDNEACF